jgi:hypothetical protein
MINLLWRTWLKTDFKGKFIAAHTKELPFVADAMIAIALVLR